MHEAPQEPCSRVNTVLRNTYAAGRAGNTGTSYTFICENEEEYAPDLVKALQESGTAVPRDLMEIAVNFHGSAYGGEEEELRRLGFVPQYISKASDYLTYSYNQARTYVPDNLRPQLVSWEQFASKHGQPVVDKLTDRGLEILLVADGQVHTAFASIYGSNRRNENITTGSASKKLDPWYTVRL